MVVEQAGGTECDAEHGGQYGCLFGEDRSGARTLSQSRGVRRKRREKGDGGGVRSSGSIEGGSVWIWFRGTGARFPDAWPVEWAGCQVRCGICAGGDRGLGRRTSDRRRS